MHDRNIWSPFARRVPKEFTPRREPSLNSDRRPQPKLLAPLLLEPKKKPPQPRQKPPIRQPAPTLANLTTLVQEMNSIFKSPPNPKINKSLEHRRLKLQRPPQKPSKLISLRNKSSAHDRRTHRRGMRDLLTSHRTKPLRDPQLNAAQSFFEDFHAKSKFLLAELEKSVLGQNKC